ncbi:hypothetical protein CAOG_05621 [Capsaspora owczarzaki ATCC 30864]|uniref:RING-type domain-containing protein n=1 Tax=Capsaspora owczarzaki (strain ATCC 30864) TaxID=595528 RepID=A0A0D2WTU6_CAPO3|nr:hypothetical protein CAOG_05621 [Capsaspora owczarzaki ATCC 30864]KJE95138.1 hypothetical protein CAOG_005621 [Capsaspora owczarzaki ATCC 30864]|eukprot:XP_004346294.1 hypothetical protein CAOG_05621 [Capsaspora owczarzaki ATCC 30864]
MPVSDWLRQLRALLSTWTSRPAPCCSSSGLLRHVTSNVVLMTLPDPMAAGLDEHGDAASSLHHLLQASASASSSSAASSPAASSPSAFAPPYVYPRSQSQVPASVIAANRRRRITAAERLLRSKHGKRFMVYNTSDTPLLNARNADAVFDGNVVEFHSPCQNLSPDAHPLSLDALLVLCRSMRSWLHAHPKNVAVIVTAPRHASLVITCCLVYCSFLQATEGAEVLDFYQREATACQELIAATGQTLPSHRRFVLAWIKLLARKGHCDVLIDTSRLVSNASWHAISRHRSSSVNSANGNSGAEPPHSGDHGSGAGVDASHHNGGNAGSSARDNSTSMRLGALLSASIQTTLGASISAKQKASAPEADPRQLALLARGDLDDLWEDEAPRGRTSSGSSGSRSRRNSGAGHAAVRHASDDIDMVTAHPRQSTKCYQVVLQSISLASLPNLVKPSTTPYRLSILIARNGDVVYSSMVADRGPKSLPQGATTVAFAVNRELSGDYWLKVYCMSNAGPGILLCDTTFHTCQVSVAESTLYVQRSEMNTSARNSDLFPEDFALALQFSVQLKDPMPAALPALLASGSSSSSSSSSSRGGVAMGSTANLASTSTEILADHLARASPVAPATRAQATDSTSKNERSIRRQTLLDQTRRDEEMARELAAQFERELAAEAASASGLTTPSMTRQSLPFVPSTSGTPWSTRRDIPARNSRSVFSSDDFAVLSSSLPTSAYRSRRSSTATVPSNTPTLSSPLASSAAMHEEVEECQVCRQAYDDGELVKTLPCFHRYHSACIDPWLLTKGQCPVCHTSILIAEDREYDD